MKIKSIRYLIVGLFSLVSLWVYNQQHFFESPLKIVLSPQELVSQQLAASALAPQSVWDQKFLAQDPIIKEKIAHFEKGQLCKSLKELDNKNLSHKQLVSQLKEKGFICVVRPLAVNPTVQPLSYLKIDNTITQNPKDKGVVHQEICQNRRQPECVIRIKRDGFPLNRRSAPHSSKAVLMDGTRDPSRYDNEAFKVGSQGQPLPKGPSAKFGLKKCPYQQDKIQCDAWVDAIMEEAHPILKEPLGTK